MTEETILPLIRSDACATESHSRSSFVAAAVFGLGALFIGDSHASDATTAVGARTSSRDRAIFRFALQLESLQARFYEDALAHAGLRGELREFAEVVADHESQHERAVARAASQPLSKQTFDFRGVTRHPVKFAHAAQALEDLGVAAYNGQLANLTDSGIAFAARIVSVEGRHAAWIRDLLGAPPAPRPVDPGEAASKVAIALKGFRFRRRR
jgi:rubrerythrin